MNTCDSRSLNEQKENEINIEDEEFRECLPGDAISNIMMYQTFDEIAKCAGLNSSWRNATSGVKSICIKIGRHGKEKLKFAISRFFGLRNIHIKCWREVDPELVFQLLQRNPGIRNLTITGCFTFLQNALEPLDKRNALHLEELILDSCYFSCLNDVIDLLENKSSLRVLHLNDNRAHDDCENWRHLIPVSKESSLASRVGKLHNLEDLTIRNWDLSQIDARAMFSGLKRLRKLSLKGINDSTLLEIASFCGRTLQTFELAGDGRTYGWVTLNGVRNLLRICAGITTLDISSVPGTGNGAMHVRDICKTGKNLKELTVDAAIWNPFIQRSFSYSQKEEIMVATAMKDGVGLCVLSRCGS
mmetsp:Transcript_14222/g.21868  ORF Transcript_14222/g.21868 Transcript_14222/m.21868 type:complete len:359 (-) Transcript_14222:809-1885(-)